MRPAHGTLHALRTAFLAGACTGLAWSGHGLWADTPAHLGGFLAATAFLYPVLWFFTRIMRGFGDIFAIMALSQIVLHLIFQVSADPSLMAFAGNAAHSHSALSHALGFAPGMLLAHLWAALLASALLAHGESALWYLTSLLSRALPRPLRAPALFPHRPLPLPVHRPLNFSQALSATHEPRGPPGSATPRRGPDHALTLRARIDSREKTMTAEHRTARAAALALAPLTAAALVLAPAPASAHDVLTGSSPEDGQTLEELPEEVVLTFNNAPLESGEGNAVVVTGPDGESTYEEGDLTFDGTDVSVGLTPLDEAGEYSIDYRVVSSDGHPIQESISFSVTEEAIEAAAPDEPEETEAEEDAAEAEEVDEPAEADEAAAEEADDEGGVSPVALVIIAAVAVVAIGAIVFVAVRMRKSTDAGGTPGSQS